MKPGCVYKYERKPKGREARDGKARERDSNNTVGAV